MDFFGNVNMLKQRAIRPFSFESFYIKCNAKLETSIIRLPALDTYNNAGDSFPYATGHHQMKQGCAQRVRYKLLTYK